MIFTVLILFMLFLILPVMTAAAESQQPKINTDDEGYWTLARALLGGCHLKWRPDPLPIVWFDVGLSQGRLHMFQRAGDSAWWFEGRVYLSMPLGFAARLAQPATEPMQPTLPGMMVIDDDDYEGDHPLKALSIESNSAPRLMRCLNTDAVRPLILSLKSSLKASSIEIIFAHQVLIIRGSVLKDEPPSDIAERIGPQLANWMRFMITPLNQSTDRLIARNDQSLCPASAIDIRLSHQYGELWSCPHCELTMYRAAMETLKGCINASCDMTIDGIAEEVLASGRPKVEIQEVEAQEVGDLGWVTSNATSNSDFHLEGAQ